MPKKHQHLKKKSAATALNAVPQATPERHRSEPHRTTRQQEIAKTPAKLSAHQIPSLIVAFVILVLKI
jgi:hypothetical protein